MAAVIWGTVLVMFCISIITVSPNTRNDLHAVLTALEKLVGYYQRNHMYLNLDGLFGLRVIEGQLQLLISEYQTGHHQHLSQDVINKVKELKIAAQNASNFGLESVRSDDAEYFKDFSSLVSSPWIIMKPRRKLEASLRWEIPQYKAKAKVKLTEELSDRCMTELMKDASQGCQISDVCAQIMTTRGLTGYGITHQILWSILGEIMPNCSVPLNHVLAQHNLGDTGQFQLELCTNNFYEMVAVVQVLMHGKVHESHQDLFLEQQFVCPNLGFYEFMKKDYLDQILSWQFPSGCFGEHEGSQADAEDLDLASLLEGYHDSNTRLVPEVRKSERTDNVVKKMKVIETNENIKHVGSITRAEASEATFSSSQILSQSPKDQNVLTGDVLRVPKHVILPKYSQLKSHQAVLYKSAEHNMNLMNQNSISKSLWVKKNTSEILPEHHTTYSNVRDSMRSVQYKAHLMTTKYGKNPNNSDLISKFTSLPKSSPFAIENKPQQRFSRKSKNTFPSSLPKRNIDSPYMVSADRKNKNGRHILVEKDMQGGCLSHKTGVGSGALVMYLRYLIAPGNISWTGQHELFLSDSRNLLQATREAEVVNAAENVAHTGNEEEEEEEEDEEENMEQDDGVLNENVNYNEGNDAEAGDDQGDDDYNEEQADNRGDDTELGGHKIHVGGADHDSDTVVINEDAQKDSEIYADNNDKVVPVIDADDDQEEDHNYYDDEGETERGIIKRRKPPTSRPHPPVKTRRKHSDGSVSDEPVYGQGRELLVPDHPNYTVILFVSVAPFFILFFFLFKFIRKRRVHIRYYF